MAVHSTDSEIPIFKVILNLTENFKTTAADNCGIISNGVNLIMEHDVTLITGVTETDGTDYS